ncbi:oxidoreductase [Aspergillus venezuelensis]
MPLASTDLSGGVALITGAASGIGKETAFAFAESGVAAIALADRSPVNEEILEKCRSLSCGIKLMLVTVDVSSEKSVAEMVQGVVSEFGRIDYCVHAAGIPNLTWVKTADVDMDIFDKIHATNARGTMLVLRDVSRAMAQQAPRTYTSPRHKDAERSTGRGAIVVIASLAGLIAAPTMAPYASAKAAVVGMCKTAAAENISHNIRVNSVCPGWIDTPMVQSALAEHPELESGFRDMMPRGKFGMPEEVADAIVFLCSPAASFVNGASLLVDAGQSLMQLAMMLYLNSVYERAKAMEAG